MIAKMISLFAFCLTTVLLYGQLMKTIKSEYRDYKHGKQRTCATTVLCDVEDFSLAIKIQTDTFIVESEKTERYYYCYKGKYPLEVATAPKVRFKGGREKLAEYFNGKYLQKYRGPEINGSFIYAMLLDSRLKIMDVRVISLTVIDDSGFDFVRLIKEILRSTKGRWERVDASSDDKFYLAFGRLRLI